ncbi:hypothetical protein B4065_2281 [Caldibacillus thermoamylovorans]|uniref:ArdC-like ssDNA-binding domain-containing protein n=1 Tax=Caldibacillus thermoamylovorans TaxID=35841 RepID=UPI0005B72215|nr:ArdC-like ssDNA-binding domain-containing protein [Caldibacillus thermoamylovorans]KIO66594.1 hypothetical protein B4065_2281 [Caldibacillus thermoamylovorans]
MANKSYNRKTSEEKTQEIMELSKTALSQIERFSQSQEDLLEYADFMSRFYNYSANNIALIQKQFRGAVAVASFKDWKQKGYSVNKGEKGIKIFSFTPVTLFKDKDGIEKPIKYATKEEKQLIKDNKIPTKKMRHFSIGHVFDISQTNAPIEDLPKIFPNRQYNFTVENEMNIGLLKKGIKHVAKSLNVEIKDMKDSMFGINELATSKGMFAQGLDPNKKEIILNSRNTETQNIATSIHELAHAALHDVESDFGFDTATKEFQAELTSYIVCKHYGMDTSEKAIGYIAHWTQNGAKLEDKQKALEGVHSTAKQFIDTIDEIISKEKERGIDQEMDSKKDLAKMKKLLQRKGLER